MRVDHKVEKVASKVLELMLNKLMLNQVKIENKKWEEEEDYQLHYSKETLLKERSYMA